MRLALVCLLLAACSSDNKAADASHNIDSAVPVIDSAPGPDSNLVTLTVDNYLQWCTVRVNGVDYMNGAIPVLSFPRNTVVPLVADKASTAFHWDYWLNTDGDTTTAHDKNMTTTVTMTGNKKIQACCPDETDASPLIPCPPPP